MYGAVDEAPFFAWSQPKLVRAWVGSGTSDFRSRSCPQHWLSLMLSFMWLNFRPCISICLTILYMELITVHGSFNLACSTLTNLFCFAWWGLACFVLPGEDWHVLFCLVRIGMFCFAWWGLACYVLAWNILWPDFCHGKLSQLHVQQLPAYEGFLPSNGHHCEFVNSLNA